MLHFNFDNSPTINLFVYGTLNDDQLLYDLLDISDSDFLKIEKYPATLKGFEKREVIGATYPGIYPNDHSSVNGNIIQCIPKKCLNRIDGYEGEGHLYNRRLVTVSLDEYTSPVCVAAYTYIWARGRQELGKVIP